MEVDKISFYPLLLDILTDISEAHFVAFDLEMSGVPTKKLKTERSVGKPTLQERYLEIKEVSYRLLQSHCITSMHNTATIQFILD